METRKKEPQTAELLVDSRVRTSRLMTTQEILSELKSLGGYTEGTRSQLVKRLWGLRNRRRTYGRSSGIRRGFVRRWQQQKQRQQDQKGQQLQKRLQTRTGGATRRSCPQKPPTTPSSQPPTAIKKESASLDEFGTNCGSSHIIPNAPSSAVSTVRMLTMTEILREIRSLGGSSHGNRLQLVKRLWDLRNRRNRPRPPLDTSTVESTSCVAVSPPVDSNSPCVTRALSVTLGGKDATLSYGSAGVQIENICPRRTQQLTTPTSAALPSPGSSLAKRNALMELTERAQRAENLARLLAEESERQRKAGQQFWEAHRLMTEALHHSQTPARWAQELSSYLDSPASPELSDDGSICGSPVATPIQPNSRSGFSTIKD